STRVVVHRAGHFTGTLAFRVPRDTLPVTWIGYPEQALVYGWPAALGPFAGIGATRVGDSLVGAILFDSRLGVKVRPGATARFVAGRARNGASGPERTAYRLPATPSSLSTPPTVPRWSSAT